MPRPSNTVTVEVDEHTTIEVTGVPRSGRSVMTVHKSDYVKGDPTTSSSILSFRLTDEVRRSIIDALEMMR